MKKALILLILSTVGISGFGQESQKTLGLQLAPNYNRGHIFIDRGFTVTPGVFYDQLFSKRLGLNTGLHVFYARKNWDARNCRDCPDGIEDVKLRHFNLEVPVNLTFRLNPKKEKGFRTFLYSGFILNKPMATKYTHYYTGNETQTGIAFWERHWRYFWQDSFVNLGFEMRRNGGKKYTYAFGTSAKFRTGFSFKPDPWNLDPLVLNLNLKFGRNL